MSNHAASARDSVRSLGPRVCDAILYTACAAVIALLLAAVARPIATDDAWWHLALGRAFARGGPWLAADPLLFAAPGPASTSSWLADVLMARVLGVGGFGALRTVHVGCVAVIVALAARLLRREAASNRIAALGLIAFATLAAYRVFQLRPELATILATLLLYPLVLRPRTGPTPVRIALCAIGMALWANLHAGFVLGPILVAVALLGVVGAAIVAGPSPADRLRIRRLLGCLAGGIATLANPSGFAPHLAYFASGERSPALALVRDEWAPLALFSWPRSNWPPSRAEWLLVWGLLVGTLVSTACALAARRARAGGRSSAVGGGPSRGADPALIALSWAAFLAMSVAVRFIWLGIFPLLLLLQTRVAARPGARPPAAIRGLTAGVAGCALLAGFVWIGPWTRISDVLRFAPALYAQPYPAQKYFVDAIWLMRDAGLEGRLFTDYELGGFAGFWLTPRIETFVNGSLNISPTAMDAYVAIRQRRGGADGESFPELLDRFGLDLFLGTGMPVTGSHTAAHLERTPGWIPIFRNAESALYLRTHARNAANLEPVAAYYAREGIRFDPELGFEPGRVVREHPSWAIRHRMIPENFEALEHESAQSDDSPAHLQALIPTASVYASLGVYDAALEREAQIRRIDPRAVGPIRRTVWSLLRAGRYEEARAQAELLDGREDRDGLSKATVALTRSLRALSTSEAESRIRRLPLLTKSQALALSDLLEQPVARVR